MQQDKIIVGSDCHKAEASLIYCGEDVIVCIGGGEKAHVGAVALAIPRPSLADPEKISASASVLCLTGHKEDEIARQGALQLASALNRTVVMTVGLHIDYANQEDISSLQANFSKLLCAIENKISG